MDTTVRPATDADVPVVQRVAERAWHAAHDDIVGSDAVEAFLHRFYTADRLTDAVGAGERVFLVAARDGDVVGFAEAGPADEGDDGAWSLTRIYADPDRWGTGVGTALLAELAARVRRRGGDRLRLVVMADNDVGIGFYESRGFERVGDHYDEFLDVEGYVYVKPL